MSITEILNELPKLKAEERDVILHRIEELEAANIEETPEMLAAIDEGIRSLETHGNIPFDIVQARLEKN